MKGASKRKMPPPPPSQTSDTPPPKKATKTRKVKREKPNTYSIRENFNATDTNEYVVSTPDDINDLQNFRLFCNEERTRAVVFDFNKFKSKEGKDVKTPTLFFVNHWEEKKENMKNPNSDNGKKKGFIYKKDCNEHNSIFFIVDSFFFTGKREIAAKFRPQDLPSIEEALKAIKSMNPKIFDKLADKPEFDANIFVSRAMQHKKTGTPVQLSTIRHEDLQMMDK